jgi:hypothetical protein
MRIGSALGPTITALACLGLAAGRPALAGESDPYRLDVSVAFQVERFHSREADSLGLSLTRGAIADVAFDFRVLEAPMPGASKPAIHVLGHAETGKRAFGTQGIAPSGAVAEPVRELPLVEIGGGVALVLPMELVDKNAGASLFIRYDGALAITGATGYDFMRVKRLAIGFERTRGFFEGSIVELGYGHDEHYGRQFAAKRWAPRFRVQGRVVPASRAPREGAAASAAPGKAAATAIPLESPIHAFLDLTVDTDGRSGPDGIRALFGLTLDTGAILMGIAGANE